MILGDPFDWSDVKEIRHKRYKIQHKRGHTEVVEKMSSSQTDERHIEKGKAKKDDVSAPEQAGRVECMERAR